MKIISVILIVHFLGAFWFFRIFKISVKPKVYHTGKNLFWALLWEIPIVLSLFSACYLFKRYYIAFGDIRIQIRARDLDAACYRAVRLVLDERQGERVELPNMILISEQRDFSAQKFIAPTSLYLARIGCLSEEQAKLIQRLGGHWAHLQYQAHFDTEIQDALMTTQKVGYKKELA